MEVGSFFVMPRAVRSWGESFDGLPGCDVSLAIRARVFGEARKLTH